LPAQRFPDAGIFVLRHQDWHIVVCAGPAGQNGNGGHAHNDIGSFELFAAGVSWIIDPGAYLYTADYAARNRFRSTAVHNTVMVDQTEQRPIHPTTLFSLPSDPTVRALSWQPGQARDELVVEHDGYRRAAVDVIHRRMFRLDKVAKELLVHDQLIGPGAHRMDLCFLFAPTVTRQLNTYGQLVLGHAATMVALEITWTGASGCTAEWCEAAVAPGYGTLIPCHCLQLSQVGNDLTMRFQLIENKAPING
jgi:hypothetical protein